MPLNLAPPAMLLALQAFMLEPSLKAQEGLSLSIAPSYETYRYVEPEVMSIKGQMKGIALGARYAFEEHRHTLRGAFYVGEATYYGAKCSIHNPDMCQSLTADSNNTYYNVEYIGQWLMNFDSNPLVWLDGGVGYRSLSNNTIEASAYRRKQDYLYGFLGLSIEYFVMDNTLLYANAYGRMLIQGNNTSYMTDIGFDENLKFKQKDGYGGLLELGIKHRMPYADIGVEAYVDYWNISASNTATGFVGGASVGEYIEPSNYTLTIGGRVVFGI